MFNSSNWPDVINTCDWVSQNVLTEPVHKIQVFNTTVIYLLTLICDIQNATMKNKPLFKKTHLLFSDFCSKVPLTHYNNAKLVSSPAHHA